MPGKKLPELYTDGGPSVDWFDLMPASPICDGDIAFYLRHVRKVGGPVLELGAGTGRIALAIARSGFDVVGLDRSRHMVSRARENAQAQAAASARFLRGDMARFDVRRRFGVIIIAFRSFQHLLTSAAQRGCILCAHRHLRRGGRFILQLFDPRLDLCLPQQEPTEMDRSEVVDPRTGRTLEVEVGGRRNDPLTQTLEERWKWTERDASGSITRESEDVLRLRWTYRQEMAYLLELAGFHVRACYSDFSGSPPRYGAEQVWVAEKP